MYLVNKTRGTYEVQLFASYSKKMLQVNEGVKVDESNPEEVSYYRACVGRGLILLPTKNYNALHGIEEPKEVKEEPKEVKEEPKEPKEPKEVKEEPKKEVKEEPKKEVKEEPKKEVKKVVKKRK